MPLFLALAGNPAAPLSDAGYVTYITAMSLHVPFGPYSQRGGPIHRRTSGHFGDSFSQLGHHSVAGPGATPRIGGGEFPQGGRPLPPPLALALISLRNFFPPTPTTFPSRSSTGRTGRGSPGPDRPAANPGTCHHRPRATSRPVRTPADDRTSTDKAEEPHLDLRTAPTSPDPPTQQQDHHPLQTCGASRRHHPSDPVHAPGRATLPA